MSALGAGLLSGVAGAMQGAESYITQERDFKQKKSLLEQDFQHKMTVAEFQAEQQRRTAELKHKFDMDVAEFQHFSGALLKEDEQDFESGETRFKESQANYRAEVMAGASSSKKITDTRLKTAFNLAAKSTEAEVKNYLLKSYGDKNSTFDYSSVDSMEEAINQLIADRARAIHNADGIKIEDAKKSDPKIQSLKKLRDDWAELTARVQFNAADQEIVEPSLIQAMLVSELEKYELLSVNPQAVTRLTFNPETRKIETVE